MPLSQWKRKNERLSPVAGGSGTANVSSEPAAPPSAAISPASADVPSVITKNYARPVRRPSPHRKKPLASIYEAPSYSSDSSLSSSSTNINVPERRLSSTSSSGSFLLNDIPTHSEENSLSSSESSHEEFSVTAPKRRANSSAGTRTTLPLKKRRIVKRPTPTTAKSTNIPSISSLAKQSKTPKSRIQTSKNKRQSQSATRTIDRRQRRRRKSRQTLSKKLKNIADGDAAVDAPQPSMISVSKRRKLLTNSEDDIDTDIEVDSNTDSQSSS